MHEIKSMFHDSKKKLTLDSQWEWCQKTHTRTNDEQNGKTIWW